MKKFVFIPLICLLSCQKSEVKPVVRLSSQVSFRATYINNLHALGYDSVYIEVLNNETFSFVTHDNPCKNIGYGFSLYAPDTVKTILPYIIRTERDTLERGVLWFDVTTPIMVKQ